MATYDFDVAVEPSYVDFIDIAAGYGVLSIPVDGILQDDYVQTATLTITNASGTVIVSKAIDMTQRTDGFFEFRTQSEVDLHFSLSAADVAAIAGATSPTYSASLYVMRNGVTVPREVQGGNIAARSASVIPPLLAASVVITGGPVTGEPMDTAQLTGTVRDGFGNIVPLTITWATTNPNIASVDVNGLVTFVNPGAVTISATCQGLTATTTATTSVAPLVPADGDVAFYVSANSRWEPHQPTAGRIKPGTFSGTAADVYAFPGPVGLGGHDYTFPAVDHAGYFLQSDGAGNLAWALPLEDIGLGNLNDVTLTSPQITQVLMKSAGDWVNAYIVSADITDATSSNTPSRVVLRDGSGNFASGTITAATGIIVTTGGVTVSAGTSSFQAMNATTGVFSAAVTVSAGGVTVTGNSTITGTLGGITTLTASTLVGALSKTLTFGTHLTGTSFNNAADVTIATDATSANTVSTIVARDASGNVALGTLTAATGVAVTTGGITVSAGLSALQGMTATTGVFSSSVSAVGLSSSSGFTVSVGATSVQALAAAGDFAIATNKFTVAAASGNTLIAGTLGVTGQITGNVTGALTGNASTATAWQTARTIWGQSIDGTANVSGALTVATGGITVSSGTSSFQALTATTGLFTGTMTSTLGTVVASTPAFSSSATWNNGAVAFVQNFVNVTDTASAGFSAGVTGSVLAQWQVNGSDVFVVDKVGITYLGGTDSFYTTTSVSTRNGVHARDNLISLGNNTSPLVRLFRIPGSFTSPTAATSGQQLCAMVMGGYDGVTTAVGAQFRAVSTEAYTSTAHGTQLIFSTVANGTTAVQDVFTLGQDKSAVFTGTGTFATGLTVSAGTTGVQALTATTGVFSSTVGVTGVLTASNALTYFGGTDVFYTTTGITPPNSTGAQVSLNLNVLGSNTNGVLRLYRINGGFSTPTALATSSQSTTVLFGGYDGSVLANGASIVTVSTEAWSASAHGMRMQFAVAANGGTVLTTALTLDQDATATFAKGVTISTGGFTVSAGTTAVQAFTATTVSASGAAGINGKTPVANVAAPTAAGATYTATEQTLLNDIRTRLINFGIYT